MWVKLMIKKFCLALPKDRQSFCEVQKKNVVRLFQIFFLLHMDYPNVPKMQKFSKKSNWKWVK